jgi:hypothetical protein
MPNVGKARDQLACLHAELLQLESNIRRVRELVQNDITQSSESSQHALLTSDEDALVARIAENVVARQAARPEAQRLRKRYVREREAAEYLGVSVAALRSWRLFRSQNGPPFTRLGKMVLYPVTELEKHMADRIVPPRR